MTRAVLLCSMLLALGCQRAPAPLVEAPGARAVLAGAELGAALVWAERLGIRAPPGAAALPAEAPWAASVLADGNLVIVVRAEIGVAGALAGAPVLGEVRAVAEGGHTTLVRPDRGRVLLAIDVSAEDRTELAAVLEVMATAEHAITVAVPPPGTLRVRLADELVPLGVVEVQAERTASGELVVHALAAQARADVVAALTAPAPPWACALDEGALAVLAVPPMVPASLEDAFDGPVLIGLYPRGDEPPVAHDPLQGASLVVAGAPRSATSVDEVRALMPDDARELRQGQRQTLDGGRVRVVVDEGLLAIGFGAAAPMSRVSPQASCPSAVRPLAAGDLAAVARALPGMLPERLQLVPSVPMVARAARDGAGLALVLRVSLPQGVPF